MEIIADLHIHSRHSRATSKNLTIDNLEKWAKVKGITLLGTGDFQHPIYRKEIDEKLTEDDKGILRTKSGFCFIWQTEISLIYTQNNKGRAVHLIVLAPNKNAADKITSYLLSKGRIDYDGRPIFGIPANHFVKDLKDIDDKIEIIAAHCLTPWFGLFGSKKGFNSLKECFQDQADKIYAVESGLSANPLMLWRLDEKMNIVSFSDSHGFWPWRLGREATIFDIPELSYDNIINAIRTGQGLAGTIEVAPAYGIYHFDGHRDCNFSCAPSETRKLNGICPVCKKPLTIGVEYRIEELAKHEEGFKPPNAKQYYEMIPLHELIALNEKTKLLSSKKVWKVYNMLIDSFGTEFNILLNVTEKQMKEKEVDSKLISLIMLNRFGKIKVKPGYDGLYGVPQLDSSEQFNLSQF